MLIAFAGKSGSGKDYAAQMLAKMLAPQVVKNYKLADPIKQFCRTVFDWTEDHTDGDLKETTTALGFTPRHAMQTLGSDWARKLDPDCWVNLCLRKVYRDLIETRTVLNSDSAVRSHRLERVDIATITDIRFRNEAEAVLSWGGYLIYLDGGGLSGTSATHISETSLEAVKPLCDVCIDNSARDSGQLNRALESFLERLRRGSLEKQKNGTSVYRGFGEEWRSW